MRRMYGLAMEGTSPSLPRRILHSLCLHLLDTLTAAFHKDTETNTDKGTTTDKETTTTEGMVTNKATVTKTKEVTVTKEVTKEVTTDKRTIFPRQEEAQRRRQWFSLFGGGARVHHK